MPRMEAAGPWMETATGRNQSDISLRERLRRCALREKWSMELRPRKRGQNYMQANEPGTRSGFVSRWSTRSNAAERFVDLAAHQHRHSAERGPMCLCLGKTMGSGSTLPWFDADADAVCSCQRRIDLIDRCVSTRPDVPARMPIRSGSDNRSYRCRMLQALPTVRVARLFFWARREILAIPGRDGDQLSPISPAVILSATSPFL